MLSPVERAAQAAWKPQDIREPWEWAEDNIEVDKTSPMPGKWRSANSPWVKELMEVAANKLVSFIAVKCSAQSSKTLTLMLILLWLICEDPGPSMYVMANQPDADDFVRDRFSPMLHKCEASSKLLLRETRSSFTFANMPLYFVGAGSPGKLQGKPMKRLFLDEVRNYDPGALETVMKRVRAFGELAQIFIISTAGKKNDAVDQAFDRGDQRTFHFPCPQCGMMQQLVFDQLKAEHPETHLCVKFTEVPGAYEDGQWDFEILGRSIRYVCANAKCGHMISDTPTERKAICRNGRFIRMNPKAEACDVSFTWNALLPWWVSWKGIVKEFLLARAAAKNGFLEPLQTFINETLGESWEDRLGIIEDYGFLEARKDAYDYGEAWPEEQRRFLAADKQEKGGEHYWWVVRAFGPGGKSRLIAHGKAMSKPELEGVRKQWKVAAVDSMIDSGYMAQDVYRFCISTGWKCFKGDPVQCYFTPVPDPRNPKRTITLRLIWRKTQAVVYNAATKARIGNLPLYTFAHDSTHDYLAEFLTGLLGDWTIPENVAKEYMRQIVGDVRREKKDGHGIVSYFWETIDDNHYRDCERMILIAAIITKTIASPTDKPAKKADSDAARVAAQN